jgi:FKBP-type peptidyl-prolyl cis-trans isomerase FkpA
MPVTPLLRSLSSAAVAAACVVFASCSTYSEDDKQSFEQKIENHIAKNDWEMTASESGLYYQVLQEGTGDEPITFGSEVTIGYKGMLLNGKVVDQTPPNKPLKSLLKGLIKGFQEGLLGQTKGAKVRLILPPQIGYGDSELEKIPANSILVFEVEVVEVH